MDIEALLRSETAPRLDNQDPSLFGQTPSQTVGPFFHYGLPWKGGADLVGSSEMGARAELFADEHHVLNVAPPRSTPEGEPIALMGRVFDGNGDPVRDAMIELWQADAAGTYASPIAPDDPAANDQGFIGFGRAATAEDGEYRFRTIRPGRVPGPGGTLQAPHIALSVFGRGLLKRLATRLYFADGEGNDTDPVLSAVPAERRRTLIAQPEGAGVWRLDIHLRGQDETVFFDL